MSEISLESLFHLRVNKKNMEKHRTQIASLWSSCNCIAIRCNHRQLFGRIERRKEEKGKL